MAKRLLGNPSPYLEQHADNPVDWWPWSDEAFAEAKRRDVPIFLSIGYATCHWCHVMAHESFEDEEVAQKMNDQFVCIKVDREERPDIDDTYMAVCQAMNGSGGWPLTVMLDHDKRPWFAGTYFPKNSRGHHIGMNDLVPRLGAAWHEKRDEIIHSASHILENIKSPVTPPNAPRDGGVAAAASALSQRFDPANGGFGSAPKFPSPHQLTLLLRHHRRTKDEESLAMVTKTLDAMAAGGIHDHVGGGFHRYSTDPTWLLPHFEKMLYDQASLLTAYTEAWQVTGNQNYRRVAADIVTYVMRDLRHPEGGFFSAEDADSEGEEGTFYVWDWQELVDLIGAKSAKQLGAKPDGNFDDEATRKPSGKNIIHFRSPETSEWQPTFELLRAYREKRIRPLRDEKILADWNGLWLTALTRAAMVFDEPSWLTAAIEGGQFLRQEFDADGQLRHRWRDGVVDEHSFLDDFAFVGLSFTTLFEATGDSSWLVPAKNLADGLLAKFVDAGAFLQSPKDSSFNLARRTDAYDGAIQSGNAGAVEFLWRLGRITGEQRFEEAAENCAQAFGKQLNDHPSAFCAFWGNLNAVANGTEIVVAGDVKLRRAVWREYVPEAVRIWRSEDTGIDWIDGHDPAVAAVYVCQNHACKAPVSSAEEFIRLIGQ